MLLNNNLSPRARTELNDMQARVVCLGDFWKQVSAIWGSELSHKLNNIEATLRELRLEIAVSYTVPLRDYQSQRVICIV